MALAGKPLDDWQAHVLEGAMGERQDGRWTAFEVGLVVPRQNGKNVIIEARELAGLLILQDRVIIHSAHQFKTARKSFRDMERLIRTTPSLYQQVLGYKGQGPFDEIRGIRQNGSELSIELQNGCKLEYQARSTGGGRGFTGDLIVLDEAYDLSMDEIAAMLPTMAARSMDGNPQIWYTSSAGMPKSDALADLRERGMGGESPRLAYYEWSAPDDADSGDVDAWYQANPGLGIRISEEYIRDTEYESMGDEQFRRERLGIWAKIGGDAAIPSSAWARCLDEDSVAGSVVSFAVDVPPSRDVASIAAVSEREDGRLHVEVVDRLDVPLVPQRLALLKERWGPRAIVVDAGSAAGSLLPEIKAAGVRTLQISPRDYGLACANVYDAIMARELAHTGQAELDDAVAVAVTKPFQSETLWKWNRSTQLGDISPLVAVTLAWHGHQAKAKKTSTKPGSGWKVVGLG